MERSPVKGKRLNIALVSDYFYPRTGGVETHIMMLGKNFVKFGHFVVVITHKQGSSKDIVFHDSMKVYYLDLPIISRDTVVPTLFCSYVLYKKIFQDNMIDVVHGHQSMSTMCMEALYHAQSMGIRCVLTDHSIFEFNKIERILCNALGRFICRGIDKVICVSKIASINTSQRLGIPVSHIEVIPNGIDSTAFFPRERTNREKKIRVLFCARLVFRKGINLLAESLPYICEDKRIEVLIGGVGPMQNVIEQSIDEHDLHDQVKLLGPCKFAEMPQILRMCDIFLSTSLTETFCMAILEAVACGLLVVSTNVGGIHEVFEDNQVYFCKPEPEDIAEQVSLAANRVQRNDSKTVFERLAKKYNWEVIARDTERVYMSVLGLDAAKREQINAELCHRRVCRRDISDLGLVFRLIEWFASIQRKFIDFLFDK